MEKQRAIKMGSVILALLLGGGAVYWWMSKEPKRELNAVTRELCFRTAKDLAKMLPRIDNIEDVLLVPVVGGRDEDKRLQSIIIEEVSASRKYSVKDWDGIKHKLNNGSLWDQFMDRIGLVPGEPPKNFEECVKAAKELGKTSINLDGVLLIKGDIRQGPRDDALGASVTLVARFHDMKINKELKDKERTARNGIDSAWDRLYLTHKLDSYGFINRFLLWIGIVVFLPWGLFASGLLRPLLRKKKNHINATLLGIFTTIGTASAWPLLLVLTSISIGTALMLVLIAGVVGYYNYDALDYMERRLL